MNMPRAAVAVDRDDDVDVLDEPGERRRLRRAHEGRRHVLGIGRRVEDGVERGSRRFGGGGGDEVGAAPPARRRGTP